LLSRLRNAAFFAAVVLAAVSGFECAAFADAQPVVERSADTTALQAKVKAFDEVWLRVSQSFYDPKFHGLDWKAVGDRYRSELKQPGADLAHIINRMLAELGVSHTGYYTPAETAYYDLADIFAGGLRDDLSKHFPKGEAAYIGIGILTRVIDGKTFVIGVLDGFPAAAAKLSIGDEIIAADGQPFDPIGSFAGKAGRQVSLTVRHAAGAQPERIVVTPERLRPNEMYRAAMEKGARIIEVQGRKIGYVHIWSYARYQYQALLEELLTTGKLKDADALIWDLRGGWGGAEPGYLDIFNPRGPTMILTDRNGERDVVNGRWRKPVVLLINGGTRSGKEVLAYGFKKYGFGKVIGEKSAGAVLAARAFLMSNGDLLLLAVTDVAVDGERLEALGVTPDITVPFDIRYAQGADPQLARAIDLLAQTAND
jgi:carboxyl-terminal processing protease